MKDYFTTGRPIPPQKHGDTEEKSSHGSRREGLIPLILVGFGQRDRSGSTPGAAFVWRTHSGKRILILYGFRWFSRAEFALHEAEDQPKNNDDDYQPQGFHNALRASVSP